MEQKIKKEINRLKFIQSIAFGAAACIIPVPAMSFGRETRSPLAPGKTDLLFYHNAKGEKKPVTNMAEWQIKRQQILAGLEKAMGKLPSRKGLPEMNVQFIDQLKEKKYTRHSIQFTVAENETLPAYLYIPSASRKKFPAMLALHPTGPLGKGIVDGQSPLLGRAYAKELAERGYVVIAPDYPGFGDLKNYNFKTDRYESGVMKSIFDSMRCIDLLQARPDVDQSKIGVIGHSLGGHSAIFTGAFDSRLKVIVSSCGWTLLDYYNAGPEVTKKFGHRLAPWAQEVYMPLLCDTFQLDPSKIPFDFDEVIAALAPRAFFSNSPLKDSNFNVEGVRKGIEQVSKVFHFLKAENNLQVRYPDREHDFPEEVRFESYEFIDKTMGVRGDL